MEFPKRKAIRLPDFDYSSNGAYFVTICTHNRRCLLSDIGDVIRVFKSITTRRCRCAGKLFQRSFHDHIIRGDNDYIDIWEYIDSNASKWIEDRYYSAT